MLKDQGSLSEQEWYADLRDRGAREGYFSQLGRGHSALFVSRNPTLVVTFEAEAAIRRRPGALPLGLGTPGLETSSHLCLIARGQSWFRDPEIYAFFDRLVDDAFFEGFDNVVFYGAGMGGYAAAAYSVTAPGATVVLVQPQATLDPAVAGWDPRYSEYRRLTFTDRYGYAPDMTEGAGSVFLLYDPDQTYDAMHAALFRRPFTTILPCRNMGGDLAGALGTMHILPAVLKAAAAGHFDAALFHSFYRARRNHLPYLRKLASRLATDGRPYLEALLARNAALRLGDEPFRQSAEELQRQLARAGRALPPAGQKS